MPFKRHHSHRCADADILASASAEITSVSAAVQRQASADGRYPVLPVVAMSAVYSVLSRTKNFSVKGMIDVTSYTDYTYGMVG